MVSRTTDDYQALARMGCVAISEPAFWAGFDRGTVSGFDDYFHQLTEVEPARAAQFGIAHYCWLCINAKEAENVLLSREVLQLIRKFVNRKNVLGIGEIGLNKNTPNESIVFQEHLELAIELDQSILIHTPHLEDKYQGTRMILDMLADHPTLDRNRVLVDHVEEHTAKAVIDAGYWAGMTLYPVTKCTPKRAVDIVELVGTERICVNSASDWGPSNPTAVPDFMFELRQRGFDELTVRKLVYDNPRDFFRQSPNFDAGSLPS